MVLILNGREGTVWLLDVSAQLRKARARVLEEKEDTVDLDGLVGDLQNPQNISFDSSSGPSTIDSCGVVEDWILEEEEEEEEETDTIDIASVNTDTTEPLEEEEEEEANDIETVSDIENTSAVENVSNTDGNVEPLDWDAPEYVPTWLSSVSVPLPSRPRGVEKTEKTKYRRRSKRFQRRSATSV